MDNLNIPWTWILSAFKCILCHIPLCPPADLPLLLQGQCVGLLYYCMLKNYLSQFYTLGVEASKVSRNFVVWYFNTTFTFYIIIKIILYVFIKPMAIMQL